MRLSAKRNSYLIYYGFILILRSLLCPLRMIFLFRIWLIFYTSRIYTAQMYTFRALWRELLLGDQFRALLRIITWILTFGCFLAIILTFIENYALYFLIIFISSCSVLVFRTYNVLEFYLNFEITLFPIFIMILGWGYQPERFNARIALLIYTITGSLPLFVYISILRSSQRVFFWQIMDSHLSCSLDICFYLTIIAFLVKLPIFLFHIWLPKAHVEAPVFGSIFLAGTLLKLGGVGFIRFLVYINFPVIHKFLVVSLISLIYVGIVCSYAGDIKIIIAYSSVAHIALALAIFFFITELSIWSGAIILLTHGFSSSLMFLIAYILYSRSLTRNVVINQNSLVWSSFFSLFWFLSCVGIIGGPPASTLVREVLGILSMIRWWGPSAVFLIVGALLGGAYRILLFSRTYHSFYNSHNSLKTPLSTLELSVSFFHVFWLLVYFFLFHWIIMNQ